MIEHQVQWASPSPLWLEATAFEGMAAQKKMREPTILRFATDSFMDDFFKIMETDPSTLRNLVAIEETWRGPAAPKDAAKLLEPKEPQSSFARKLDRVRLVAERARNRQSLMAVLREDDSNTAIPLKLYQPAHQRYYLVTACLVCGIVGLPDRALDVGNQERVGFVMRRLLPSSSPEPGQNLPDVDLATWDEYAMVVSPMGIGWQKIEKVSGATPPVILPGEERLPLFPVCFAEDDRRKRRLFAGLVPVGKREAYMGAPVFSSTTKVNSPQAPLPKTTRKILFRSRVAEPWRSQIERAAATKKILNEPADPSPKDFERDALLKSAREQLQTISWLILLDFAQYLSQYVKNVWEAIEEPGKEDSLTSTAEINLLNALKSITLPANLVSELTKKTKTGPANEVNSLYTAANVPGSLCQALKQIIAWKDKLEKVIGSYDRLKPHPTDPTKPDPSWPDMLFPLADPVVVGPQISNGVPPLAKSDEIDPEVPLDEKNGVDATEKAAKQAALDAVDKLVALVVRALPKESSEPAPALPLAAQPVMDIREGWFVIRCVFERPNCGPLKPSIVSEPTAAFQMAGFFDPDAPARPIRIALPVDTSPAGLSKFDKNTAFMISDVLCGQIQRLKGLNLGDLVRSVLPWPFHKDLSVPDTGPCTAKGNPNLQLGMICSLSIPIITICALLLLMIIVNLLDIVFRWVPYFIICFPLPGFKAKR